MIELRDRLRNKSIGERVKLTARRVTRIGDELCYIVDETLRHRICTPAEDARRRNTAATVGALLTLLEVSLDALTDATSAACALSL
jgi:hypothetical protein